MVFPRRWHSTAELRPQVFRHQGRTIMRSPGLSSTRPRLKYRPPIIVRRSSGTAASSTSRYSQQATTSGSHHTCLVSILGSPGNVACPTRRVTRQQVHQRLLRMIVSEPGELRTPFLQSPDQSCGGMKWSGIVSSVRGMPSRRGCEPSASSAPDLTPGPVIYGRRLRPLSHLLGGPGVGPVIVEPTGGLVQWSATAWPGPGHSGISLELLHRISQHVTCPSAASTLPGVRPSRGALP
jgi:hypothetical protein